MPWNGRAAGTFEHIFSLFGLITQPLSGANRHPPCAYIFGPVNRTPATFTETSANDFVLGNPVDIQIVCTSHKPNIKPQFVLFTLNYVDATESGATHKRYQQELVLTWPGITDNRPSRLVSYATADERRRFFDFLESENLRPPSPTPDNGASQP
jgi:hypothetical protein